jgi:hypothetical protein
MRAAFSDFWFLDYGFGFHLAAAARLAISLRSSGVIDSALALPPLSPPRRPRATAAGFFRLRGLVGWPVAAATI